MRDLSVLSDIEFEMLVADLLAAELGKRVERFARGRDGGIDLRWTLSGRRRGIGQCKHYSRSTFSQLVAAAKAEMPHLAKLNPSVYMFATSQDITPGQKDALVKVLHPYLSGPQDILGLRDLDGLITRFPAVEHAHPKLWLASGAQLFWATHSDLATRASALRQRIDRTIPRYVTNESFLAGASILDKQRVCLIAGVPGIGKTTLAHALLADAMARGYEPCEVSGDISEAWATYRPKARQIFLYDDFLGQLTFSERLGKNEDSRLADFVEKVYGTKTKLLVMTTREYILQDAERLHPKLAAIDRSKRFLLELGAYTREDRARILYNHLWQTDLSPVALSEVAGGGCIKIVDHQSYSPRLIEYCTGPSFDLASPGYVERFLANLDHPTRLWGTAFEDHLTDLQQLVAVALATLPTRASVDDLATAHEALCRKRGVRHSAAQFRSALQVLEGTFVAVDMVHGTSRVEFHNPSIRAFVLDWVAQDGFMITDLIDSAVYFEQVRNLCRFAMGTRRGSILQEPGPKSLTDAVARSRNNIICAFERLINSATPETVPVYLADSQEPVRSWFEDRLRFLAELPLDMLPPRPWLDDQLQVAAKRWNGSLGSKGRAAKLVAVLQNDRSGRISAAALAKAADALDDWLPRDLTDTSDDWLPYLARLEDVHGVWLPDDRELAERFEAHARDELDRWDPLPPDMSELIDYADRFRLDDLKRTLEERASEEERREEAQQEDVGWRAQTLSPTSVKPAIGDADIRRMFARLANKAPSGG